MNEILAACTACACKPEVYSTAKDIHSIAGSMTLIAIILVAAIVLGFLSLVVYTTKD